jgi:hypothetical protein
MFAASKSSVAAVIQTFTSNATWVAPAGITGVNISGSGSPAVSDYSLYNYEVSFHTGGQGGSGTNPPFAQWGTLYGTALTSSSVLAGNSGTNQLTFVTFQYVVDASNQWRILGSPSGQPITLWVVGSGGGISVLRGSPPTSGDMTYASASGTPGWVVKADEIRIEGSVGVASTGLSKTFPGGTLSGTVPYRTAVAPTPLSFAGVAVVPGTSYPIVVPSGGVVTISYYR